MEPKVSLPFSQEPATGPYPEPDATTPQLAILFPSILILSSHLLLGLPNGSSLQAFRPKFCTHFSCHMRATCPDHLKHPELGNSLRDLHVPDRVSDVSLVTSSTSRGISRYESSIEFRVRSDNLGIKELNTD
jgi:hypothetical protein